ncbi:hypothetical protein [Parvularcula sp. LCG005]|uniref:hypothetical protein n=1 Tax=Parvularcula sp. LCG005 TaxID=3078805 RepID=UPI0029420C4C|nr:hypothetical protein [Parvularcula sp. LCG005]WOI51981.1 hypothetical protein RUI03_07405 [Parvularcula sp. LCG005]
MQHTEAAKHRANRNRSIMRAWRRGVTNAENAELHNVSLATIKNVIRALRAPERHQQAEIEAAVIRTLAREITRRTLYSEGFEHGQAAAVDRLAKEGRLLVDVAPVDPPSSVADGIGWQDAQRRWFYRRQG